MSRGSRLCTSSEDASMNIDPSPSTQMPAGTRRSGPGGGAPRGVESFTAPLGSRHPVDDVVLARVLDDLQPDLVPADRLRHLRVLDLDRVHALAEVAGVADDVDHLTDGERYLQPHRRHHDVAVVMRHRPDPHLARRGAADRRFDGLGPGLRGGTRGGLLRRRGLRRRLPRRRLLQDFLLRRRLLLRRGLLRFDFGFALLLRCSHGSSRWMERCNPSRERRTYQRSSARTAFAIASPSAACWSASRCTPSTRLDGVTVPASKKWQPSSAHTLRYSSARPRDFAPPPSNLGAIGPFGSPIGGGAITRTGGTGMPGSIGAPRMAATSAAIPCPECQALCGCIDWKSLVPSARITSASGELTSMRCARPTRPLRPGLYGSSHTVRRPFRQSSITRTARPSAFSRLSMTPGQRASKGRRLRVR